MRLYIVILKSNNRRIMTFKTEENARKALEKSEFGGEIYEVDTKSLTVVVSESTITDIDGQETLF